MSTLKIMTFLRSMIKVRDVVLPPPDGDATTFFRKLKCVTARATYMPDTITRQPSAFLVHLSNITDRFEENHRVAYVPGSPVWAWEIAQPGGGWGGGAGGVGGAEQEPEAYD